MGKSNGKGTEEAKDRGIYHCHVDAEKLFELFRVACHPCRQGSRRVGLLVEKANLLIEQRLKVLLPVDGTYKVLKVALSRNFSQHKRQWNIKTGT